MAEDVHLNKRIANQNGLGQRSEIALVDLNQPARELSLEEQIEQQLRVLEISIIGSNAA